ncbi:putative hydrolase [Orenia metallireducens]|jgi:putative hydrolase|uniref:Putative hydrolase n=1 Tax=Orenia metallireducens TaxID=1413210 RepID=A0A285H583_9FIRM|nr:PHP domain-containing protein [Orenia metallireducens]PRX28640.1 putative hydrolase [Orenia metallireducens]SNY30979.1 putative hydrolase [Orenia metallireducens]
MQLYADYHTHTVYSHGTGSIRENIEVAIKKGLKEIAISDHGPASHSIVRLGVEDSATLLEIKKEVDKYNRLYPEIKVLAAVEANVISIDGRLDVPEFILRELDKVLVGFHLFIKPASFRDGIEIILNNTIVDKLKINHNQIRYRNTEILINTLNNYDIDIITHPGYKVDIDTRTLAKVAVKKGVALEINSSHGYMREEYIRLALEEGAKFILGSDAHSPDKVGDVKNAMLVAQQAGLTDKDIINVC